MVVSGEQLANGKSNNITAERDEYQQSTLHAPREGSGCHRRQGYALDIVCVSAGEGGVWQIASEWKVKRHHGGA